MNTQNLRPTLARLLRQSRSHAGLQLALEDFPVTLAGHKIEGFRHTAWEQLEHLRLATEDLVSYCRNADYEDLGWPDGYWPDTEAPPSEEAWTNSVQKLLDATETLAAMVEDEDFDLFATVPSSDKAHHDTYRAALILLDHNGYHAGQLIAMRIALGAWPPD